MRIGNGFDVHAFGAGDAIILGGISIPHSQGIEAHSDGDVLIHALCDALLGAAALGDIGHFFPDTDAAFENADSRVLLRKVVELIKDKGFSIGNADNTIVTQAPKLASYIEAVRANLADDLAVPIDRVSVKATTSERLGFVGREEGIAVYSVVLLTAVDHPSWL